MHLNGFSVTPITIFPLAVTYNTVFWDFRSRQQALRGQNVSRRSALPNDTTTKVEKDANFTILTSEM